MSSHTNDGEGHLNNKDKYVLESCSSFRGGDLNFDFKRKTKNLKQDGAHQACQTFELVWIGKASMSCILLFNFT